MNVWVVLETLQIHFMVALQQLIGLQNEEEKNNKQVHLTPSIRDWMNLFVLLLNGALNCYCKNIG